MAELNIDLDFFEHPKTMQLCAEIGHDWAEIFPIRLWRFTARFHKETGVITDKSAKQLEYHLKWKGEKGKLTQALIDAGFLEPTEAGLAVHDFLKRNGHLAALSERGKHAAKCRWENLRAKALPESGCLTDAQALHKHQSSNTLAYLASEANSTSEASVKTTWVFREWLNALARAPTKHDVDTVFDELSRLGYTDDFLIAAIKDKSRDRTEAVWDFVKNVKRTPAAKPPKKLHPKPTTLADIDAIIGN